ncbi:MAG: 30S ribosomal protein S11 [Candidatus Parcubacteria bacterium]|nr:MAG: 30S ribosomal protein S11 [Candidatus Parcubacteria bacterium]
MGKTRTKIIQEGDKAEAVSSETSTKKKDKKKIFLDKGRIYINAKFNNTLITLTDDKGNVMTWASSGSAGLKNTKKGTPYAGTRAMEHFLDKIKNYDINELKVLIKGIGPGRETALRVLFSKDYNITEIADITPIPFGGPTKPRPRRV